MSTKTEEDFDYGPTLLNNGWSEFYLTKFLDSKEWYIKCLGTLREMGRVKTEEVLVKTFEADYETQSHPRTKSRIWQQIEAYIKKHQSSTWIFSHIVEEEVDTNCDPYEDWEMLTTEYQIFATIKEGGNDIKVTEPYLIQLQQTEKALDELEENKSRFWEEVGKEKQ